MTKHFVLRNQGMGGFLNPPTHPEHSFGVDEIERGRVVGSMSLSYAAEQGYEPAKAKLAEWIAPPIEQSEVQDWIHQVLGYFSGCYRGHGDEQTCWHVSNLDIDQKIDPVLNADLHAGVHLVRKYYPEFTPKSEHFANAYWGTKKERAS